MKKIAYLASRVTIPVSIVRRTDAFEHDFTMDALRPAFEARGMGIEDLCWDDTKADWASFDAAIIGTTWDYWDRPPLFLETLVRIEAQTQLFNTTNTVRWNMHKSYLTDLEAKGARLIPTLWIDSVSEKSAADAFDALHCDDLVFKRQVGAGAAGQHRLKRGEPVPDMPHAMMVQPFLSTIQTEGEISFIFIDGEFSHALIKRAKAGDYRIQSSYGGFEEVIVPAAEDQAAVTAIIGKMETVPLYARVDVLRGEDGELNLMELELIEPYLYPKEGPHLGALMAAALQKRVNQRR